MTSLPPSGVITFLMTDIEGSTRLWDDHPAEMAVALREHDQIIRRAVSDHEGYVFTQAGDGFAIAFSKSSAAMAAALDAQSALHRESWPVGIDLRVRMGIHTGTATERDGDYFGPSVNRAARLLSVANGGQVLLSAAAAAEATEALPLGVTFRNLGEHRLRDLSLPERIVEMLHPDLPPVSLPLRSLNELPNNLPIELTSFVGRQQEMAELRRLMVAHRMVTVAGVGGSGKTRLALHVASQMLDEYPDGVWLVELAAIVDPGQVLSAVAAAVGVADGAESPIWDKLVDHLRRRELLLILDNCEHLVEVSARLSRDLLEECPGITVLATSREMLGVPGEAPYQLRSMSVPSVATPLDQLSRFDAVRLFVERAGAVRPGFRIDEGNAGSVLSVIRRLDGIPLAIELAAARLRLLTPEQLAGRLDDRFRLLTGGARTALPRQQTLQAAIDWSYDLLSEAEKALFRRLSVFQGGFTLEAAEWVCADDELPAVSVFDLLSRLVEKSLVLATDTSSGVRYRLLETLRQYARDRLVVAARVEKFRRRHAAYFHRLVERAVPHLRGPDEQLWLDSLEEDHDNLRQALRWAIDSHEATIAQGLAAGLYRFWMYRLHFEEGRRWLEEALGVSGEPTPVRGRLLVAAATFASLQSDMATAESRFAEGVPILRDAGDTDFLSAGLNNWGSVRSAMGRHSEACCLFEEAEEIYTRSADHSSATFSAINLASCTMMTGDLEATMAHADRALEIAREGGSGIALGTALATRTSFALLTGEMEDAAAALSELEKIAEYDETHPGEIEALYGWMAVERGGFENGRQLLHQSIRRIRGIQGYQQLGSMFDGILLPLARAEAGLGNFRCAATLVSALENRTRVSWALYPKQLDQVAQIKVAAHEALGSEHLTAAVERGKTLSFEEVLELALTESG